MVSQCLPHRCINVRINQLLKYLRVYVSGCTTKNNIYFNKLSYSIIITRDDEGL